MWQRFTERARKVVFYAQEEAKKVGECDVTPDHFLLGLLREDDHVAARMLTQLGVSPEMIRAQDIPQVWPPAPKRPTAPSRPAAPARDMQLTPRAKRVIDFAYDEARQLNNNYIGTEHLLLGLLREGGSAGQFLAHFSLNLERTRAEIAQLQGVDLRNLPKNRSLWQRLFQKQFHS